MTRSVPACLALCALLATGVARAEVPCAGDGPPLYEGEGGYQPSTLRAIEPTALVAFRSTPYATDGATGLALSRARLGVCGVTDTLAYRLVWEPWSQLERAAPGADAWGRIVDASVAWSPVDWSAIWVGIGKVPVGRAREFPVGALALPSLPASVTALAPDRRLGGGGEVDLGVARGALALNLGGRDGDLTGPLAVQGSLRVAFDPLGPVARRETGEFPRWTARPRFSGGVTLLGRAAAAGSGGLLGFDAALAWGALYVAGEVLVERRMPLETPGSNPEVLASRLGAWGELVARVAPGISVAARADFVQTDRADAATQATTLDAGASWVLPSTGGPFVELQAMGGATWHGARDDHVVLAFTVER